MFQFHGLFFLCLIFPLFLWLSSLLIWLVQLCVINLPCLYEYLCSSFSCVLCPVSFTLIVLLTPICSVYFGVLHLCGLPFWALCLSVHNTLLYIIVQVQQSKLKMAYGLVDLQTCLHLHLTSYLFPVRVSLLCWYMKLWISVSPTEFSTSETEQVCGELTHENKSVRTDLKRLGGRQWLTHTHIRLGTLTRPHQGIP